MRNPNDQRLLSIIRSIEEYISPSTPSTTIIERLLPQLIDITLENNTTQKYVN